MSKGLKGFLIGLFVIVVAFVLIVLIMASVNKNTFVSEIKSWFPADKEQTSDKDVVPDADAGSNDNTGSGTEVAAVIVVEENDIKLKLV